MLVSLNVFPRIFFVPDSMWGLYSSLNVCPSFLKNDSSKINQSLTNLVKEEIIKIILF